MPLLKAVLLSALWVFGLGQLQQPEIVISKTTDGSVYIPCKLSNSNFKNIDMHWYRQKSKQAFEHLMYVRTAYNQRPLGGVNKKLEASKNFDTSTSNLKINFLKKEDEATYYCTYWDSNYAKKVFGGGTKVVVIDESSDGDTSPKPTIFLPSIAEINLHKAGTYLCLLEKFFPDVITVYWKEKDGNSILRSQQGDTMKTKDTYMKLSWLTVTGASMDKQHKCIVKHEKNQGRADQEILFPPVNEVTIVTPRKPDVKDKTVISTTEPEACVKDENGLLNLQLTSTSAYYTYLLLLLKGTLHGALITYCLCGRYPVCCDGKST
uniref:Ig-like domain-containing protein n=1 Tax=Chinchilla lanigera TaxID=34839 RepID=A0A8C2VC10_CHILA